jgi:hypothetical protein
LKDSRITENYSQHAQETVQEALYHILRVARMQGWLTVYRPFDIGHPQRQTISCRLSKATKSPSASTGKKVRASH